MFERLVECLTKHGRCACPGGGARCASELRAQVRDGGLTGCQFGWVAARDRLLCHELLPLLERVLDEQTGLLWSQPIVRVDGAQPPPSPEQQHEQRLADDVLELVFGVAQVFTDLAQPPAVAAIPRAGRPQPLSARTLGCCVLEGAWADYVGWVDVKAKSNISAEVRDGAWRAMTEGARDDGAPPTLSLAQMLFRAATLAHDGGSAEGGMATRLPDAICVALRGRGRLALAAEAELRRLDETGEVDELDELDGMDI
jgi:hypothetical protein